MKTLLLALVTSAFTLWLAAGLYFGLIRHALATFDSLFSR